MMQMWRNYLSVVGMCQSDKLKFTLVAFILIFEAPRP